MHGYCLTFTYKFNLCSITALIFCLFSEKIKRENDMFFLEYCLTILPYTSYTLGLCYSFSIILNKQITYFNAIKNKQYNFIIYF